MRKGLLGRGNDVSPSNTKWLLNPFDTSQLCCGELHYKLSLAVGDKKFFLIRVHPCP